MRRNIKYGVLAFIENMVLRESCKKKTPKKQYTASGAVYIDGILIIGHTSKNASRYSGVILPLYGLNGREKEEETIRGT